MTQHDDASDTWSNTKLLDLCDGCGEHFRRRWMERETTGGTLPMRRGSAVHWATRAAHLRQKEAKDAHPGEQDVTTLLREALPTRAEMRDLAADEFQRLVDMEGVTLTEDEEAEGPGRAHGRTKDAAADMAGHYVRAVAPFVNPVEVERKTVIQLPNGIKLAGTKDLVDLQVRQELGQPPRLLRVLRDLKTRAKAPSQHEARKSQQLTLYDTLHLAEHQEHADAVQLDVIVRTPVRGEVRHVPLTSYRDDTDTDALLAKVETAQAAVKAGVFVPNTEAWRCDVRYCEFFRTCRYVSGRRRGLTVD